MMTFDHYWQEYGYELNDILDGEDRAKLIWEDSRRVLEGERLQAAQRFPQIYQCVKCLMDEQDCTCNM